MFTPVLLIKLCFKLCMRVSYCSKTCSHSDKNHKNHKNNYNNLLHISQVYSFGDSPLLLPSLRHIRKKS